MTSKAQKIDEILGKALRSSEFRVRLAADPKLVATECGLSVDEMTLISGGLAIGDSLLNPQTVAWCTDKTCNETGDREDARILARRMHSSTADAMAKTPITQAA
jgi:hypothetical protein